MAEWSGEALVPSLQFVHDRDSPAKSVGLPMCEIWGASLALYWLLSGGVLAVTLNGKTLKKTNRNKNE